MIKNKKWMALFLVMILVLQGCSQEEKTISETGFVIGTIVTIQLKGTDDEAIMEGCFDILSDVDSWMSLNVESSLINQLNNHAGQGPMEVDEEAFYVIKKAIEYGRISGGLFDVSMEPVIDLWGIGTDQAKIPNDEDLNTALSLVGYDKIILDESRFSVDLPEGMSIDLGGIGKGYAADLISEYLKDNKVSGGIINLGGNIVIMGSKEDNAPYRVGVQNPFETRNDYFGVVEVIDKTVVTSGIYERNFEEDGILYHHILNPEDGYPMNNGVAGVTVITTSIDADALSTVLFLSGIQDGLAIAESMEDVECIFVDEDKNVYLSQGVKDIFNLSDSDFTIVE